VADESSLAEWGEPAARGNADAPSGSGPARAPRGAPGVRTVVLAAALVVVAAAAVAFALGAFRSGSPAVAPASTPPARATPAVRITPATVTAARGRTTPAGTPTHATAPRPGAPNPTVLAAAFQTRIVALCTTTTRSEEALGTPTQSDLAVRSARAVTTLEATVNQYAAVVPSAGEARTYRTYLAGLRSSLSQLRLIAAAAKAGDINRVKVLAAETTPAEAAGGVAASSGGFDCSAGSVQPAAADTLDAAAEELAHSAQVAIESYGTDNNGNYAGATPAILNSYESTIQISPGGSNAWLSSVRGTAVGYTVTATATNGDRFSIIRTTRGSIERSCTTAAGKTPTGCSATHTW